MIGATPPLVIIVWLYATPLEPFGRDVVVKVTGRTMVIVAVEVTPEFALEIASRLTLMPVVSPDGAVYVTDVLVMLVKVPQLDPAQPVPVSGCHVTPRLRVSLPSVASKSRDSPWSIVEVFGVIAKVMLPPPPPQLEMHVRLRKAIAAHPSDPRRVQRVPLATFSRFLSAKILFIRAYTFNVVIAPWISFSDPPGTEGVAPTSNHWLN